MKSRIVVSTACGAALAACLVAGCGQDVNISNETDVAKLELPKGVSATPQSKPYKSRSKRSAPAVAHNMPG